MSRRRVVVTGVGIVCPVGVGKDEAWRAILAGKSGIGPITQFDASTFPTRIAGEVRGFEPEKFMDKREVRRNDRFIHFGLAAAEMALADSGLELGKENLERVGCIIGAGMGGLQTIEDNKDILREKGVKRISPFFIPALIINLAGESIFGRWSDERKNTLRSSRILTESNVIMRLIEKLAQR